MARIRTIKPDFFKHEQLFQAEIDYQLPLRIAFAGLWCVADRRGRFKWRPRAIKLEVLPYDEIDFSRVLDALSTRGFLKRYACGSEEYGVIINFNKHQSINNKECESILPNPDDFPEKKHIEQALTTRQPRVNHASTTPLNLSQGEGKGREGKGKEGNDINKNARATLNTTEIVKAEAIDDLLKTPMGDTVAKQVWFEQWKSVWCELWQHEGTARRFFYSVIETEEDAKRHTEISKKLVDEYRCKLKHGVLATFLTPASYFTAELWKNYIQSEAEIIASKPVKIGRNGQAQTDPAAEAAKAEKIRIRDEKLAIEDEERKQKHNAAIKNAEKIYDEHWAKHYPHVEKTSGVCGDKKYWHWYNKCCEFDKKLGIPGRSYEITMVVGNKPSRINELQAIMETIDWVSIDWDSLEK